MCVATVGWRNMRVVAGLRPARAAWWDKKAQLVRARLQRARWRMHDSMSTRAIPRSSVAKAPVDKRVANILATPGKIRTAHPSRFKSLIRHEILPCVVFMDILLRENKFKYERIIGVCGLLPRHSRMAS